MRTGPTPAELDALTAWWICGRHIGHAATFIGRSRQTLANNLNAFRREEGVADNVELALRYMAQIEQNRPLLMRRKVA